MIARIRRNGPSRNCAAWTRGAAPKSTRRRSGAGFTLVELLVVVVIIAALMALILPAINRARISVNEGRVVTEIRQLESAITAFKTRFGIEPPSQMVIYTTAADWNSAAARPYRGIIRRMWPQFDFNMAGGQGTAWPSTWGAAGSVVTINAGECLMFFLGGIIEGGAPRGFAKNPATPFAPPGVASNREGPFFEFDINRIKDSDGNGVPEYVDSLPSQRNPYLYFSSYEGKGYRVTTPGIELPVDATPNFTTLHDVYRVWSGSPVPPDRLAPASPAATPPAGSSQELPAHKAQSFQIISPGYDGEYGWGGTFNPQLPLAGLRRPDASGNPEPDTAAFDNLTNFHSGRLNPQ